MVEREGADCRVEFGLEAPALGGGRLLLARQLFDARLLLVGLRDVARDELAGLGGLGERLDVLTQALLVGADLCDLPVDGGDAGPKTLVVIVSAAGARRRIRPPVPDDAGTDVERLTC